MSAFSFNFGVLLSSSRLLSCVTEHLTAEIVQLTITDITRAIEWMKCSYLYVRMKKVRTSIKFIPYSSGAVFVNEFTMNACFRILVTMRSRKE